MKILKPKTQVNIDLLHEELSDILIERPGLGLTADYCIEEEGDDWAISSDQDISTIVEAHNKQDVSKAETNRQIRNQRLESAKAKLRAVGLTDEEIDEIRNS